ncbi:whole genome shotgun sequence [Seminavis robusta]|uniref:Whole genome shotgun sequence n=1 Tax=Seminavis robusta TaxID=568900 RepID=A0A9N8DEL5_9STRA|nr:whole genome shotgun sequence [Seminavis robusta]|eukprot:Sro120_g058360.1 whole genome shotgun sequence (557) ;mRNA; f:29317-30987
MKDRLLSSVLLLALLLLSSPSFLLVAAKRVSGDFKLSGVNSEKVLGSFAVLPSHGARFSLNLTASNFYESERSLFLRVFNDVAWGRHLTGLTCQEKIRFASNNYNIAFDYIDEKWQLKEPLTHVILSEVQHQKYDPSKMAAHRRRANIGDPGHDHTDVDDAFVNADERDLISKTRTFTAQRPQYWYWSIDDCMLEQFMRDDSVPMIHFELEIVNSLQLIDSIQAPLKVTHLSADEMSLTALHTFTLIVSGLIAAFLLMNAGLQTASKSTSTIHVAVLWVALAATLDAMSSFCEICHLKAYERNGIGSYVLDALAAHLEAVCDSLLMLLILSIGAGWTLPSDAVRYQPSENAVQRAFTDLASPLRSMVQFNLVGMVCGGTIAFQAFLCQWGRTYNDDFESYHDLEHLPGKILMLLRIFLGFVALAVTMRTSLQAKVTQLQSFYRRLAVLGFLWFQSLPFVTWMCNLLVPYYLRHPAVFLWSALLQSSSIVALAFLVTSHSNSSAFAQYSHMTSSGGGSTSSGGGGVPSLAESMGMGSSGGGGGKSTFSFGKTKIAID